MPDIASPYWRELDLENDQIQPNGFPPGMPAYIDQSGRMVMGAIKRSYDRSNPVYETTGVSDVYIVTPTADTLSLNLYEIIRVRAHVTNTTTAPTLQFSKTAAATIVKIGSGGSAALVAGDILAGGDYSFWWNGTNWILSNPASGTIGDVEGPTSATDSNFAAFDGTTGKLIKDSGSSAASFATAAQGALASTALQPADIGSSVEAWSANLDAWSALATSAKQNSSAQLTTLSGSLAGLGGYLPFVNSGETDFSIRQGTAEDLTFIQAGTGAITRTSDSKIKDFAVSPEDFGAKGDNATTDDAASINAALAAVIAAGGGTLFLGPKRYRMSSPLIGALAQGIRVRIAGHGKDGSELVFDAGVDGLDISIDGDSRNDGAIFIYDDLTLTTLSDVAGTAATFTGTRTNGMTTAMLSSSRVKMKGVDSTKGWAKGATHSEINGADYLFPEWLGKQNDKTANAWEFSGANSPTDIRMVAPRATWFANAVDISGTVEGIMVQIPMFVGGQRGIYHHTPATEPQLEVHGGHMNVNTFGVWSSRAVQSVIEGVLIYEDPSGGGTNWVGIQINNGDHVRIYGNTIHGWSSAATTRYGIVVGSNPRRTTIFGNTLRGYDASHMLTAGISFDATEDGSVREFGNVFDGTTVTTRVNGGITTGARESRVWSNTVIITLAGGAATENVDVAIPSGVFTAAPLTAILTDEGGIQFLVAMYDQQNVASTKTNARFVVTRADGTNIGAGAHRFGISAIGD